MYNILRQCRLHLFGHFLRMSDERIPKALLYSEFVVGKRNVCRSKLRYKDVYKRNLKNLHVDIAE